MGTVIDESRPELTANLTGAELRRWYWLTDELADLARRLGVRATGGKALLTERLTAALDGEAFAEPMRARHAAGAQLSGTLTASTPIPPGQRCSQIVRAWFVDQVGPSFVFDATMRSFFAGADGTQTLQDALTHYRTTRGEGATAIDATFEYNRFTRRWHRENPGGARADLLRAWQEYRALPVDRRGRA